MELKIIMRDFDSLGRFLQNKAASRKVYYLANPGNWGDAIIRYGTLKFFKDYGIAYTELSSRRLDWIIPFIRGGVLIYGGGGGWCKCWHHAEKIVSRLSRRFEVIVLPSTFERPVTLPNVSFFARDRFESLVNMPCATFCHDMAFYIGRLESCAGIGTGHFFRTDRESSGKNVIPDGNLDISLRGNQFSDVQPFTDVIAQFAVVHTDRLHVAIVACLLGREVHLYSGSYFKSRAIYDSSLKDFFPNVHFHAYYGQQEI